MTTTKKTVKKRANRSFARSKNLDALGVATDTAALARQSLANYEEISNQGEAETSALPAEKLPQKTKQPSRLTTGGGLREVDPETIGFNPKINPRQDFERTATECAGLIEEIRAEGQQVPVLLRPALPDSEYKYELVYGSRRCFVAQYLNKPVLAVVRSMSDIEAAIAAVAENKARADTVLVYEARMIALYRGQYESMSEFCKAFKKNRKFMQRIMNASNIPDEIIKLYPSSMDIVHRVVESLTSGIKKYSSDYDADDENSMTVQLSALAKKYKKAHKTNLACNKKECTNRLLVLLGKPVAPKRPTGQIRHNWLIHGKLTRSSDQVQLSVRCKDENKAKQLENAIEEMLKNTDKA